MVVAEVSLEHSHVHLCIYCVWMLCWVVAIETVSSTKPNTYYLITYIKSMLIPDLPATTDYDTISAPKNKGK